MLDEIDKVGMDFRGDPCSALLEVLDPEQNNTFQDNYLEVPFDLSGSSSSPPPTWRTPSRRPCATGWRSSSLPGYTQLERLRIAQRFLVPKQLETHGLTAEQLEIEEEAMVRLIQAFTHEAGVRNMERELANVARKVARRVAGDA